MVSADVKNLRVSLCFGLLAAANQVFFNEQLYSQGLHKIFNIYFYFWFKALYFLFCFITSISAPVVIGVIGPRATIQLGFGLGILYFIQYFYQTTWTYYLSVFFYGVGNAFLWIGQGFYMTTETKRESLLKTTGILWTLIQIGIATANSLPLIMSIFIKTRKCFATEFILKSLGTIFVIAGVLMALILKKPKNFTKTRVINNTGLLINILLKFDMLLLVPIIFFIGLNSSYTTGLYSSVVTFSENVSGKDFLVYDNIGALTALGGTSSAVIFGVFVTLTKWRHCPIASFGFILLEVTYIAMLLILPANVSFEQGFVEMTSDKRRIGSYVLAIFLGFGESCFVTLIYSRIGEIFWDSPAQAYALYHIIHTAGYIIGHLLINKNLHFTIITLIIASNLGTIAFIISDNISNYIPTSEHTPEEVEENDSKLTETSARVPNTETDPVRNTNTNTNPA